MFGIIVAVGFVGMVLAPCAIALRSRLGNWSDPPADAAPESESLQFFIQPPSELIATPAVHTNLPAEQTVRPVPLPAPVRVPSLREVADRAAAQMRAAQVAAAQARAVALVEASKAASRRAEQSAKLAEAAELELVRATQAAMQAEAAKAQAKSIQREVGNSDYLPSNHPSLDFPRSRVPSRRVA